MRRVFWRLFRWAAVLALVIVLWVVALRWVNPPITYLIASEWIRLGDVSREWRGLDEISPHLPRAAMGGKMPVSASISGLISRRYARPWRRRAEDAAPPPSASR